MEGGREQQRLKDRRRSPARPQGMNRSRGKGARWTPAAHAPRGRSSVLRVPEPHVERARNT